MSNWRERMRRELEQRIDPPGGRIVPLGLVRVPGGVRCRFCQRGWKLGLADQLGPANVDYLCTHVEMHLHEPPAAAAETIGE